MPIFKRMLVFVASAAILTPLAACNVEIPRQVVVTQGPPATVEPPQQPVNPQNAETQQAQPVSPPGPGVEPTQVPEPPKVPEPEPPKAPELKKGTYRITINGLAVKSQTSDHMTEQDGKGDEIYVDLRTKVIDKDGNEVDSRQNTSSIMGDTNQQVGRVQAGSARGANGGIVMGDKLPNDQPWVLGTTPSPDRLPLGGGEITLVEGQEKALITPTVWEWDGGSDLFTQFTQWFDKAAEKIPAEALGPAGLAGKAASSMNLGDTLSKLFGVAGDRPIGITSQSREGYTFDPQIVTLDFAKAEEISGGDFGYGKGVRLLTFKDAPQFAGHYELYYQVTKVS
ncbi:hypothetical protein [Paenarthrobacter nitroguajacolicus]